MKVCFTFRRSGFWSMGLWLMLGCGAGTDAETASDPIMAAPAGMSGSVAGRPAAAAESGSSSPRVAATSTATGGAGSAAGSGGVAAVGTSSAGADAGVRDAGAGAAGAAVAAGAAGNGDANAAGAGGAAGSSKTVSSTDPLTVYIASDSTASSYKDTGSDKDQAGWGQMLPEFVKPNAKVDNRAIGGRTARRFIDDGALDKIWKDIHAGDYLLVQFGTNDGNKTATYELNGQQIPYYLDPETDFKTYIKKYIEGAQQHGATIVLVTPPPRNSAYCTGGNGTGAHAQALRELGESEHVSVVDLNQKAVDYLKAICPEPSTPNFFLEKPDGSVDGTHFQKAGARKLASFVAEGLQTLMVSWIKD